MAATRILCAFALALAAAGCGQVPVPPEQGARPVWPPPPAEPRIEFVKAFSQPGHLGISKGLFRRIADVLFGGDDARLVRPMAIVAVGPIVYVADPGARGVHRFDPGAQRHDLLRAEGDKPLASPVGLARGRDGEVYVTDSASARVLVIRPGAAFASPLPLQAKLRQPTGIAVDPASARLFVVDTSEHRVLVFRPDGALESSIGRRGEGDGEFNYPTLAWRDDKGRLYVTDSLNFRTQVFDERGAFVAKFGRPGDGTGDAARQKGVATDQRGHVYVVDSLFHAFQVYDPSGRFLLSVGERGSDRGEFWLPTGIFIGEDDTIYVADSYNRRVQVFRYIGGPT
jgi:DNA-binding beta-propeller fold protein YncE